MSKQERADTIKRIIFKTLLFAAFNFAIFFFIFGVIHVKTSNMNPMVKKGDLCVIYRLDNAYLNDVVLYEHDGKTCFGRIAATGGQVVDFKDNGVYEINNMMPAEQLPMPTYADRNSHVTYPLTLKEDEVFILNDNRDDKTDSRRFGAIPRSEIKGKLMFIMRGISS